MSRKEQLDEVEVGTNLRIEDASEEEETEDGDKEDSNNATDTTGEDDTGDTEKGKEAETTDKEEDKETEEEKSTKSQIEGAKEGTPRWLQDKIDKSTRKQREAERERDSALKKLEAIETKDKQQVEESTAPKKPDIADYENTAKFMTDWETYQDWKTDKKLSERDIKIKQEISTQSENKTKDDLAREFADGVSEKYGDEFVDKIDRAEYHPVIMDDILLTQNYELAHYLAIHPEEANRIANMSDIAAVKAYGLIEHKLSGDTEQKDDKVKDKKKKLPNPIDAAKQNATIVTDAEGDESCAQIEERKYGDRAKVSGTKMVQM